MRPHRDSEPEPAVIASNDLRERARAALERFGEGSPALGRVERVSVDVVLGTAREIVSLRLGNGPLRWSCSCGEASCAHARVALEWLREGGERPAGAGVDRVTPIGEGRASLWPTPRSVDRVVEAGAVDRAGLASALDELVLAVVRTGTQAGMTPMLEEVLDRLEAAAPEPMPLCFARWVGRVRGALSGGRATETARLLAGATVLADDLRQDPPSGAGAARIGTLLGPLGGEGNLDRIVDRTLIEVARERLAAAGGPIERRYLVDLGDGRVYREDRRAGEEGASLGPCPRVLQVGLATVEPGISPRRVKALQYTTTPAVSSGQWAELSAHAGRRFEPLLARHAEDVREHPGLCEPIALVGAAALAEDPRPCLRDATGSMLALGGGSAVLAALASLAKGPFAWVAGRLVEEEGSPALVPLAVGVRRADGAHHARM